MRGRMSALAMIVGAVLIGALALGSVQPSASGLIAGVAIMAALLAAARVLSAVSANRVPNVAVDSARYRAATRPAAAPQHPRTAGRPIARAPAHGAIAA